MLFSFFVLTYKHISLTYATEILDDVRDNSDLYSMVYVPNPFIVPGGRFREFYYWDSYWIVKGLLISHMNQTVDTLFIFKIIIPLIVNRMMKNGFIKKKTF